MAPPAVADLSTLINQYQTALKPQSDQLDTQIAANDASGVTQAQGLDAKKTQAFGDITQSANDRGGYFSGFSPDAQAKYTAGTYLPALAQLQDTIATTRGALLGKKADLSSSANTSALGELNNEKSAYQQWQQEQAKLSASATEAEKQRQFDSGQNDLNRQVELAKIAAANAGITPAQQKIQDVAGAHNLLSAATGSDGRVSPQTYAQAKALWSAMGYSGKEFDAQFAAYRNPNNKSYKLD